MKRVHILLTAILLTAMIILPRQVTSHAQVRMTIPDRVWHEDVHGFQFSEPDKDQEWGESIYLVNRNR